MPRLDIFFQVPVFIEWGNDFALSLTFLATATNYVLFSCSDVGYAHDSPGDAGLLGLSIPPQEAVD